LGCCIICSEFQVEVDRLIVEFEDSDRKSKVKVVRPGKVEVEDIESKLKVGVVRPSKFKVEEIDNKLKMSTERG
jgi:hypothetical protein